MAMEKSAKIFVAGAKSLIGAALIRHLKERKFKKVISDSGVDLINQASVRSFFNKERPNYVFLAHLEQGGILANIKYPAAFIYRNLAAQNNVIDSAYNFGVKKLIFLASSCVYPKECPQPIKEEYLLTGRLEETNEPYSIAKIAGIKMCQAYNRQYGTKFISAIPATVYGRGSQSDLENSHVIHALLKKIHYAKKNNRRNVVAWGTGKPRREFIHEDDLAIALIFLMDNYNQSEIINAGYGEDISIKELAMLIKGIIGFKGSIIFDKSKPDGVLRKILDSSRLRKLGWKPKIDLKQGLEVLCK